MGARKETQRDGEMNSIDPSTEMSCGKKPMRPSTMMREGTSTDEHGRSLHAAPMESHDQMEEACVRDIMTADPVCCTVDTPLVEVARLMRDHDCGAIPVVGSDSEMRLIGIITDRDIVCRLLAQGGDPVKESAECCMTENPVTVSPETSVTACIDLMEERQLRRLVVTSQDGCCCGIVAQADIAQCCPAEDAGEVVREVSQPQACIM